MTTSSTDAKTAPGANPNAGAPATSQPSAANTGAIPSSGPTLVSKLLAPIKKLLGGS